MLHADARRLVDAAQFREGMSWLAGGVTLVTTDGPAGRRGLTATSVCSVTDDPPTLLVCVNRASASGAALAGNGIACVNVLRPRHRALAARFAGAAEAQERFEGTAWTERPGRAPELPDAAAAFQCRLVRSVPVGTHDVLVCRVESVRTGAGGGVLGYLRRALRDWRD
ncbi:flavin reductase [Salinarimonas sp.]|uniref:flavin reductase n=1 Tax=Salinarimonas sp. TaxID=2766526 RepID=UPI00391B82AB